MTVEKVRVAIRARGGASASRSALLTVNAAECRITCKNREFHFSAVYDSATSQDQIFDEQVLPYIDAVCQGLNATIFAYGQTGSGKTFTVDGTADEPGILPRSFAALTARDDVKSIAVEFLEVYNENIKDLIAPDDADGKGESPRTQVHIREDGNGNTNITGHTIAAASTAAELAALLERGRKARRSGSTEMNTASSRSHAVFRMTVATPAQTKAVLSIVDLAGSERISKTKTEGERFVEGTKINLSLTCLGQVISALTIGADETHVPYRDSKLTRLLKQSLGGNSKTLMLATISPEERNEGETLCTLRFADRVKNVRNAVFVNQSKEGLDEKDLMLRKLEAELKELRDRAKDAASRTQRACEDGEGDDHGEDLGNDEIMEQEMLQRRVLELETELAARNKDGPHSADADPNDPEVTVEETFQSSNVEVMSEFHRQSQRRKLQHLYAIYLRLKYELRDQTLDHQAVISDLKQSIRFLETQIQSYQRLLRLCIPRHALQYMVKTAKYNDEDEAWELEHEELAGNDAIRNKRGSKAKYLALVNEAWSATTGNRSAFRRVGELGLSPEVLVD